MLQEMIIGRLRKNSFDFISVSEPDLLQNDPSRKLMRQIFRTIAEYEKAMIVLKLRGARVRIKTRTGRCEEQSSRVRSPMKLRSSIAYLNCAPAIGGSTGP